MSSTAIGERRADDDDDDTLHRRHKLWAVNKLGEEQDISGSANWARHWIALDFKTRTQVLKGSWLADWLVRMSYFISWYPLLFKNLANLNSRGPQGPYFQFQLGPFGPLYFVFHILCKWSYLVAKFATNASAAIRWTNLQLMQVAPSGGQIFELIQVEPYWPNL